MQFVLCRPVRAPPHVVPGKPALSGGSSHHACCGSSLRTCQRCMAELCTGPALHGESLGAPNEPDHPADRLKLLLQGRTGLLAVCLSSSWLPGSSTCMCCIRAPQRLVLHSCTLCGAQCRVLQPAAEGTQLMFRRCCGADQPQEWITASVGNYTLLFSFRWGIVLHQGSACNMPQTRLWTVPKELNTGPHAASQPGRHHTSPTLAQTQRIHRAASAGSCRAVAAA